MMSGGAFSSHTTLFLSNIKNILRVEVSLVKKMFGRFDPKNDFKMFNFLASSER